MEMDHHHHHHHIIVYYVVVTRNSSHRDKKTKPKTVTNKYIRTMLNQWS